MSLPTPDVVREVALGGNGGLDQRFDGAHGDRPVDDQAPAWRPKSAAKLAERKIAWVDCR